MPAIRDQQQPIKRGEIMDQTSDITETEWLSATGPGSRCDKEPRGYPGQTRYPKLGKRACKEQSSQRGNAVTRGWRRERPELHASQIASLSLKGKIRLLS